MICDFYAPSPPLAVDQWGYPITPTVAHRPFGPDIGDVYGPHGFVIDVPKPQPRPIQRSEPKPRRPYLEFDTECAHGWWLLKLYYPMGHMRSFELFMDKPAFTHEERYAIEQAIENFTWVGFNSLGYDENMLKLALAGVGVQVLKAANDAIIVQGLRWRDFTDAFPAANYRIKGFDHIDIMEVTPGVKIGLKTYMARMHSKTIQDLPFDPNEWLTDRAKQVEADLYCGNDLIGTRELRETIASRIKLRETLSDELGVDLRSKSDAQMSEAIIAARLGYKPDKKYLPTGFSFQLKPAPWLQFVTPQMQEVFNICKGVTFFWSNKEDGEPIEFPDGSKIKTGVNLPPELKGLRPSMGISTYKFGIGGLHSTEKAQSVWSIPGVQELMDSDVGSFYPKLAILLQLFSPEIMAIYQQIFDLRMANKGKLGELKALKKKLEKEIAAFAGDATPALMQAFNECLAELETVDTATSGYKIVLNGWYGKLWSKYSFALDPVAGISITINGQLSLLMLIERLEVGGVRVVSANTDGIITCCPAHLLWYRDSTLAWWERATGFDLEHTPYKSVHSRDVNSYVAVTPSGEAKRKGIFSKSGVLAGMSGIHPDRDIAKEAAVAMLMHGTPISETVRGCRDICMFILAKGVKGGGQHRSKFMGKTVRWYYSTQGESIHYISNGNKVGGSDGAQPIQVLPDAFPADIDYAAYEEFAEKLLRDAGALQ